MKTLLKISIFLLIVSAVISSCKKKNETLCEKSDCLLTFDQDTVFFDTTVFAGVKTITKRLRVINFNDNALTISEISIPENSPFKLVIDGEKTNSTKDFFLRGDDELLILIEATVDENLDEDSTFITQENLKFITNGEQQDVLLVAPSINVYFHNEETLECDAIWKNDRPHVIFNSVLVPESCKLTIEQGTHIYSHSKSAIIVEGTIEAIGTPNKRIIFTDDRLHNSAFVDYDDIFGIWEGILIIPGSSDNKLDWVNINNSVNGVYANTESADGIIDVEIGHSKINTIGNNSNAPSFTRDELGLFSGYGLIGVNTDILVHNSVITNCTSGSVLCLLSGDYLFFNNTMVNYPNANSSFNRAKDIRTFYAQTTFDDNDGGTMNLILINNIIYGENSDLEEENNLDELYFFGTDKFPLASDIRNNIIKTSEYDTLLLPGNPLVNQNPLSDTITQKENYDLRLENNSVAIEEGLPFSIPNINNLDRDLLNNPRGTFWDIGAYEYVE